MDELIKGEAPEKQPGTPITREALLAEGFISRAEELPESELEKETDPFYYYKGDFRLYDQLDEFYYVTGQSDTGKTGRRIEDMESLRQVYQHETGRIYTKYEVLTDTTPADLPDARNLTIAKGFRKIKLIGGPAHGKTAVWPAVASFFIYQYVGEGGRTEGAKYQRKPGTKTLFNYAGPTN